MTLIEINKFFSLLTLSQNQQLYEALKVSLAQAEALDYLDFHPEGGEQSATLLGLKPEHLLSGEHQKKSIHQVCFISINLSIIVQSDFCVLGFYHPFQAVKLTSQYFVSLLFKSFQQNIIPELESRLKSKCEMLASFHKPAKREGTLYVYYNFIINHIINHFIIIIYSETTYI